MLGNAPWQINGLSLCRRLLRNEELLKKTIFLKDEEMNRFASSIREVEDDYRTELQFRERYLIMLFNV